MHYFKTGNKESCLVLVSNNIVCNSLNNLRWYDSLKYGDAHEKFHLLKIEDLRSLNTCQEHLSKTLSNNLAEFSSR